MTHGTRKLRFGRFEFDERTLALYRDGEPCKLSPQPAKVLWVLLSRAGELVTRDDIAEVVWPRGGVELDQAVNTAIRQIRDVLGDEAGSPRYVETHPRRGYRFKEPVSDARVEKGRPHRRRRAGALAGIAALVLLVGALIVTSREPGDAGTDSIPTVAVLPFQNLTGDDAQSFLSDGLTEEVINRLALIDPTRVRVIGGASMFRFGAVGDMAAAAAEQLGATHILEGSLREEGEDYRYRISVRLTDLQVARPLWVRQYQKPPSEAASLQLDIAQNVAGEVLNRFDIGVDLPVGSQSVNGEARLAILRGKHLQRIATFDGLARSVVEFREAIRIDPRATDAHAGLAYGLFWTGSPDEAEASIGRALDLDPMHPGAHQIKSHMLLRGDWDWEAALEHSEVAIDLAPGVASYRHERAVLLASLGRSDQALTEMDVVLALNPIAPSVQGDLAYVYLWASDFNAAIDQCGQTRDLLDVEVRWIGERCLYVAHLAAGDTAGAAAAAQRWASARGVAEEQITEIFQGPAAQQVGQFLKWRRSTEALGVLPMSRVDEAWSELVLGDAEAALDRLEDAVNVSANNIFGVAVDPRFSVLSGSARFQALLERMHHPLWDSSVTD